MYKHILITAYVIVTCLHNSLLECTTHGHGDIMTLTTIHFACSRNSKKKPSGDSQTWRTDVWLPTGREGSGMDGEFGVHR